MKFGELLKTKIFEPWRSSYLEYNELKIELKRRQLEHGWTTQDETEFSRKVESELAKVFQFIERGLNALVQRTERAAASLHTTPIHYDATADSLTEILFDVNDLAKFHQLNLTGFEKLIKKHDRWTHLNLRTQFYQLMFQQWPLDKLSLQFDVLVIKISELHDVCHLRGQPRAQQYAQGGDQTAFERATGKYWIHPDNITEVKSIILFHLPVHMFNQKKHYEESDMAVSSVYFDNPEFDLYSERLARDEGAESIRLRWYGALSEQNDSIYVERKTHKAAWLEGKSVKDRFRLKETQVSSYLTGKYTADQLAQDLRAANKKEKMIEECHFVAKGVQDSVKNRHLKPVCRVFYNRTAFQLPGDQRLRISLDSNLTFIKESSNKEHWRREEVGIDYPFRSVPEKDISRFPYAVLETKLQTHLGQESPAWLSSLIDSHLVHEVPRFSKYLHGASMLFNAKVPFHPYWLEDFDLDIRKAPITNVGLSRSMSFKPLVNGHHRQSLLLLHESQTKKEMCLNKSNKSLGDFSFSSLMGKKPKPDRPHLSINLLEDTVQTPQSAVPRDVLSRIWNYGTPRSASALPFFSNSKKEELDVLPRTKSSPERITRVQTKKIEPKTFFANERTFISWLQFCALLLTVALNLLNNGDYISRVIGAVFIIIASLLSIYALARYQIRSYQLRTNKMILRYDDVWGPSVLCVLLVTALCINFYLRADSLSASYQAVQTVPATAVPNL